VNVLTSLPIPQSQLAEKHIIKMPVVSPQQQEQFSSLLEVAMSSEIDSIIEEHSSKFQIPHCTFGVDRRLLNEIEEINRHSQILNQNCANFTITDQIKAYLTGSSTSPLVVYGKPGCGKSVLSAKIAQSIHTWIPECSFILR
jgi:DNA replication protein DnaC